jgi:hypothetical protein
MLRELHLYPVKVISALHSSIPGVNSILEIGTPWYALDIDKRTC